MRRIRIIGCCIAAAIFCLAVCTSAFAAAEAPGFELSSASYPTNLTGANGEDAVQEITPEAATFTLSYEGEETASIAEAATAGETQHELEKLARIGAGDVEVSREGTTGPLTVTFINYLGDAQSAHLEASGASVSVGHSGASSGTIEDDVFNIGAASAHSETVTVTDALPPGLRAKEAGSLHTLGSYGARFGIDPHLQDGWLCTGNGDGPSPGVAGATVVTCTNAVEIAGGGGTLNFISTNEHAYELPIGIAVEVVAGTPEGVESGAEANHVAITGGGAAEPAETEAPVRISSQSAKGGLERADAWVSNADGTVDRQAGSHPYEATFVFTANTALNSEKQGYAVNGGIRNLETEVPPGLIGDLHDMPQCSRQQLLKELCPPDSMVGRTMAELTGSAQVATMQLFNMTPAPGVPAELGYFYEAPGYISFSVKSGSDYAVVSRADNVTQYAEPYTVVTTLWGTPEASSHDIWRYREEGCGGGSNDGEKDGPPYNGPHLNYCRPPTHSEEPAPFLTLPTSCEAPPSFAFKELTSWDEPNTPAEIAFPMHDATNQPVGFTGCEELNFEPEITTAPDTAKTDTPTGVTVEVKPALGGLENSSSLSAADIKDTTVALPPGMVINPGQAVGLTACGPAEDGLTTEAERANGEEDNGPAHCPNTSKVGTVRITTPLIEADEEKQFEGSVYVLQSNPPEVRLLVAASADGVNLKLVGVASFCEAAGEGLDGKTCEAPGQVITTFKETPQMPFTDFKLAFSGGPQAALDTPAKCGTYTSDADFTPWSTPATPDALTTALFALSEGSDGSACPAGTLPFSPELQAGATTDQAGGFTGFSLLLRRADDQQRIDGLQFHAPAGLTGLISKVPLCSNAQAESNTCPEASKIGHTVVESGPGPYPLVVPEPGQGPAPIYLTEGYKGAPFGLSIVVPLHVGPFVLPTQRVRAKIEVDPQSTALTITTDGLPQEVAGVPTDLREIDAVIERPEFMVNPTNCEAMSFSGTAYGAPAPGQSEPSLSAPISSRFQVGSCRSLAFAPKLSVSTAAKTSKKDGASLHVSVTYPKGSLGQQANLKYVKVELPKALPSRLETLKMACLENVFEANPANCPPASFVGQAIVHTPALPVPLRGPAIFVSHGGKAFPSLTMVLQGDGVTVELVGETFISKGVTSSTFNSTPDVPFESFELTLPQGEFPALAANGNLCDQKLIMPTHMIGQNGQELQQQTRIAVQGCPGGLKVLSKKAKPGKLTLRVLAPAAGTLKASGRGLSSASGSAGGREPLTLTLRVKSGQSGKREVKLVFAPTKGKRLTKNLSLTLKRG